MYRTLRGLILLACAAALHAQQQPAGLEPDWDIGVILQEMSAHAVRLLPVLDRLEVKELRLLPTLWLFFAMNGPTHEF